MRKTAFICPIYDLRNHFQYGKNLLESLCKFEIKSDLYFVFSDEMQKEKFKLMIDNQDLLMEFKYLILPYEETKYKSQVTIKKFYGLIQLKDKYEYIATIDSESYFIKHEEYDNVFSNMWTRRSFLKATLSPNGFFTMRDCFKTLGIYENKKLRRETHYYIYNIWFNEIPLYKTELLDEFFTWLDTLNNGYKDEWRCYDYHIFMAFLVIEKGFTLNKYNIESLGGVMEYLFLFSKNKQRKIVRKLDTHWTSVDNNYNDNCSMRFHADRGFNDEEYGTNRFWKELWFNKLLRYKVIIRERLGIQKW